MSTYISPDKDPIGQAMMDYIQNPSANKDSIIHVDTNITEDESIPTPYFFRSYDEMPLSERAALDLSQGKILDLGAGSGVHSLHLQEKGFDVHPIDISELSVQVMKKRGIQNVRLKDFKELKGEKYDTILLLMNGIGMVQNISNLPKYLEHFKNLLTPNGQILIDSTDILYMFEEEDGSYLIDLNGEYYGQMIYFVSYKDFKGDAFDWLYVDFGLLRDAAKSTGLNCEQIVDENEGHYLAKLTIS
jgi:2-polyprenyl-3-methyl-5-hydroxy-6-metoxy-1,4-benzoquinol methylase